MSKCKHCGACDKCDYCEHCGKCKDCGRERPITVAPTPWQPWPYNPQPNTATPYVPPNTTIICGTVGGSPSYRNSNTVKAAPFLSAFTVVR